MVKKTIKKHLNTILDKEVRTKAINNTLPEMLKQPTFDLAEAMTEAFIWSESPEGHKYWWEIHTELIKNTI